ncbi:Amidase [Haliangium ochraceum DSM 14365]|uniref:Amidase n=1 Tax=Haliangium ochraceum (strain DSM 14365 / JCM 11303 / SMP-2) TaxID=502025 RepID=D0LZ19_HALO1|nr:Amidase [Haliangium ochraceum DSM 14365]
MSAQVSAERAGPGDAAALGRRHFLLGSALGVGALGLVGCGDNAACEDPIAVDAAPCADPPGGNIDAGANPNPIDEFELAEVSIAELQAGMEAGTWSSQQITELYLARIAAVSEQGPSLRAVIETNPEAVSIAQALDAERAQGNLRGPLHGVPILLKDNIATADQTTTTAGALALTGSQAPADAFVAQQLRAAGAVLLGKANLSEWANFRSFRASSGWSGRGRQCRNPYVLDRNPSGSSSGSAVAAAASLAAAAIGTETNGSIVSPASANGVVGVKPTVGLTSRSRVIPISHTQDTVGPLARTVRDAAIVLGAMTGVDPDDEATAASEGQAFTDYTQFLDAGALSGARIGVARNQFGFHSEVDARMETAIEAMAEAGAVIVDPVSIPVFGDFQGVTLDILLYEFKAGINAYLAGLGDPPVSTLADIIAYNREHEGESMPYFGQEILLAAEAKGPLSEQEYIDALELARGIAREDGIDRALADDNLDAIIAPTGGPAWPTDLVTGDHFLGGSSTASAVAGYPIVSVPAGDIFGLPVGISFIGGAWSEPTLLALAYAFEQATGHRKAPGFLPTLSLP